MGALAADVSGLSLLPSAMTLEQMVLLAGTTFIAAGVNSIAGGGTILTFPVVAAFLPDGPARLVIANATSTIGLWPGSLAAAWATRSERLGQPRWTRWLLPASVGGAIVGTMLVLALPPAWFSRLVPWLILSAAFLFALQPRLSARLSAAGREAGTNAGEPTRAMFLSVWVLQFLVAVYGGYFGAGIGILMLAVLGCLGLGDIHRINALMNVLATAVNGTTAVMFIGASVLPGGLGAGPAGAGVVSWPHAFVMALASVAGGFVGVRLTRRMPAALVRRMVALIGFGLAGYYFLRG
jgi:uncharacterized membrane protein YfcA